MLLQDRKLNMPDHEKLLPEEIIIEWFKEITSALQYLHDIPILHRDVKTSNIYLTDDFQSKLGDFGLAKVLERHDNKAVSFCGSPYYMSPEIISGKAYNEKSDIWALGVVIYELVTCEKPFDGILYHEMVFQICNVSLPPMPSNYCAELINVISQMLSKVHKQRPSAKEILTSECFKRQPTHQQRVQLFSVKTTNAQEVLKRDTYTGQFDILEILEEVDFHMPEPVAESTTDSAIAGHTTLSENFTYQTEREREVTTPAIATNNEYMGNQNCRNMVTCSKTESGSCEDEYSMNNVTSHSSSSGSWQTIYVESNGSIAISQTTQNDSGRISKDSITDVYCDN